MSVFMIISFRPLFLTLFFPSFLFCRPLKLSEGVWGALYARQQHEYIRRISTGAGSASYVDAHKPSTVGWNPAAGCSGATLVSVISRMQSLRPSRNKYSHDPWVRAKPGRQRILLISRQMLECLELRSAPYKISTISV